MLLPGRYAVAWETTSGVLYTIDILRPFVIISMESTCLDMYEQL